MRSPANKSSHHLEGVGPGHTADIVGAFSPECTFAVRAGGPGRCSPLPTSFPTTTAWLCTGGVRDKLKPSTVLRVVAVEGISDRIIVEAVGDLNWRNLDRLE